MNIVKKLLIILLLLTPMNLWADEGEISVEAEGYGISRDDALLHAKRDAVSQGIGTVLASETEVKNFTLQKDVVLTKTLGAVKKYTVLDERKDPDDAFYVKIRAVVSRAGIKADLMALKILLESMDRPRMMVMVRGEGKERAEAAIYDYLTQKEFDLVDKTTVAALLFSEDDMVKRASEGDPVAAARIGADNGAEYVLLGHVKTGSVENTVLTNAGMVSGQATISARVVNTSTGRIIASKSATAASPHISADVARDQAVDKAAKKMMDERLFEQILASFQDIVNNGVPLNVVVNNVSGYQTQKKVRKSIEELDVISVKKRGFGGGILKLSVMHKGNSDSFCEAIDEKKVAGMTLLVTECTNNRVVLKLQ